MPAAVKVQQWKFWDWMPSDEQAVRIQLCLFIVLSSHIVAIQRAPGKVGECSGQAAVQHPAGAGQPGKAGYAALRA